MSEPEITLLLCLRRGEPAAVEACVAAALAALRPGIAAEVLVVGHGPREALAPCLRDLAARHPQWRLLLQTRAGGAAAARAVAESMLRTPWVLPLALGGPLPAPRRRTPARTASRWWSPAGLVRLCTMAFPSAAAGRRNPP